MMFTGCLFNALKSKRYSFFGENGLLDSCLQEQHLPKNQDSYFSAKEKYDQYYQNSVTVWYTKHLFTLTYHIILLSLLLLFDILSMKLSYLNNLKYQKETSVI